MDELQLFEELVRRQRERIPAALAVVVATAGSAPRQPGAKMLVAADGSVIGSVGGGKVEAETVQAALAALADGRTRTLAFELNEEHGFACGGSITVYIEPLTLAPHLVAIGAGHVGQALARAARAAGFRVTLVDTCPEAPAPGFAPADVVCPMAEVFDRVPADGNTYILIATREHRDDFAAVRAALATSACYIALVGSRRKREALRSFLLEDGLPAAAFDRVITPAGVGIGARTPEEIAVSITAQLIQWRYADAAGCSDHTRRREVPAHGESQAAAPPG